MPGRPLRVGLIVPIVWGFPPDGYGPWERVCHNLAEGLVELGHDVVVFAPAGSQTSARLVETIPSPLSTADPRHYPDARVWEQVHIAKSMAEATRLGLDLVHSHLHVHALGYAPFLPMPIVSTLHGVAWDAHNHMALLAHRRQPFVSLSDSERQFLPSLNYVATIGNGIRLDQFSPGSGATDGLAFVGRMAPEKAPDLAIETARRSGRALTLAGAVEDRHRDFYETRVRPGLGAEIRHVGALDGDDVARLVGESAALLMPLRWEEPFGLVVVESLAVGTPVVAWDRGAMRELVTDGVTGHVVDDIDGAAAAVARLGELSRKACRREAEERFGHLAMARAYAEVYASVARSDHRR